MSFAEREPNFDDRDREDLEKGIERISPKGLPFNGSLDDLFAIVERTQMEWQAEQLAAGADPEISEITDPAESAELDRHIRDSLRIYGHTQIVDTQGSEIDTLMLPFDAPWVRATPEEVEAAGQDPYAYIRIGWSLKLGDDTEDCARMTEAIIDGSLVKDIAEQLGHMRELDLPED
jgi:hypothetical protein